MADTWMARTEFSDPSLRDTPSRSYFMQGLLGVMNRGPSLLEVRAVYVLPNCGSGDASVGVTGIGLRSFYRVTAASGGTLLTPTKHDTASAALPSQVAMRLQPSSVTLASRLRRQGDQPGIPITVAGGSLVYMSRPARRLRLGEFFASGEDANVQRVVLREGEGAAWVQDVGGVSHLQWGAVFLRNQATGETYSVFSTALDARYDGAPLLAVLNGVGSGVVLEVTLIELLTAGDNDFLFSDLSAAVPGLRLMLTGDISQGTPLTTVPFDSSASPLPSSVEVTRNPRVVPARGMPSIHEYYRRMEAGGNPIGEFLYAQRLSIMRGCLVEPFWVSGVVKSWGPKWRLFEARRGEPGMILREGEGLAVVHSYLHAGATFAPLADHLMSRTYENFDVAVEFTAAPPLQSPLTPLLTPHVVIA